MFEAVLRRPSQISSFSFSTVKISLVDIHPQAVFAAFFHFAIASKRITDNIQRIGDFLQIFSIILQKQYLKKRRIFDDFPYEK